MGAVRYPTLSTVKPLLYKLVNRTLKVKDGDTALAKEVKLEIKRDLQERYNTPSVDPQCNNVPGTKVHRTPFSR